METLVDVQTQIKSAVSAASKLLAHSFSQGGRLCLAGATEDSACMAVMLHQLLRSKRELRPPLPAHLSPLHTGETGQTTLNALSNSLEELRILNKPGDSMIIALSDVAAGSDSIAMIDQFSLREGISTVTLFCLSRREQLQAFIERSTHSNGHAVVPWFVSSIARKPLATLFILNCLSDMIEKELFGAAIDSPEI